MHKRLFRSRQEKVIGGVCGGLAEYYDIDPTIVRLATILLVLGLGFPIVAYIVAWIIIPRRPMVAAQNQNPLPPESQSTHAYAEQTDMASQMAPAPMPEPNAKEKNTGMSAMVPGIAMVALGLFALLKGYFWWHWEDLLPVGLVVIGIYLIVRHLELTPTKKNGDANNHSASTHSASNGGAAQNGESTLSTNGGES